jgi:hypothetical protein
MYVICGFNLNKHAAIDQQIEPEGILALKLLLLNDYLVLILDVMASQFEFHRQTPFINRLQQTGSLVLVNFNGSADHVMGQSRCLGK